MVLAVITCSSDGSERIQTKNMFWVSTRTETFKMEYSTDMLRFTSTS